MSRVQGEIDAAVSRGGDQYKLEVENEVNLSRGQTPTIDSNIYEPAELKDAGYPLSNPTMQPNKHTKEGTRYYAGRDSSDGTTIRPVTAQPDPATQLPQSIAYMGRSKEIFSGLEAAQSDVDVEMGLTNLYKQFIDYTNSMSEENFHISEEQKNRLQKNTIDRLQATGFEHLREAEYSEEGIDDKGMNGLQMVFAAGIFKNPKGTYEQLLQDADVGETGANDAQLEEAYERALQGQRRAQQNIVEKLPITNEEAMADPRYAGSVRTLMEAGGTSAEELNNMSTEEILSKGKWMADMLKSNLLALPAAAYDIKANPDSPIAEALTFLLQTDENLPLEWADAGRWTMGMIGDPTTYLGGYGIWSKFLSKKGSGAILAKLGVGATFGAGMGAGYGSLYDIGMQNIDIAARNQKGFDPARLGTMAALGGTLGYVLGGAIGLAPKAKGLIKDLYTRMKTDKPSALDDFGADIIPESELRVRRQLREFMEEDKLRKMADDEAMQKEFIELANEAVELEEKRKLKLIKGGAKEADPDHMAQMELVDAELLAKEHVEYPRSKPPVRTHDDAYNQAGIDAGIRGEEISPRRMQEMDEEWAAKQLEFADEPWIGVINKEGKHEFRNRGEGEAADWHHSMAIKNIDDWDADSSLTFYRPGDANELVIKGDSALDPMKKGKAQIKELAKKLKEQGVPGDYQLRVEEMGLHTDYEGQTIGTIDQWIKKR